MSRALRDDSPGSAAGGDGSRVQRRTRPPVAPMRPGYPPPPMPPLPPPPPPQQRFSSESGGWRSLDSLAAAAPSSQPAVVGGGSSSVMVGGAAAAAGGAPGSRSMLLLPPTASTYSLPVDPRFLHHGSSYLSAALEQSMMAQAGASGHLVSSSGAAGQQAQRGAGTRLHASAHWGAADSGMQLVARARRSLPQAPGLARMPAPLMQAQQQWGEAGEGEGGGCPLAAPARAYIVAGRGSWRIVRTISTHLSPIDRLPSCCGRCTCSRPAIWRRRRARRHERGAGCRHAGRRRRCRPQPAPGSLVPQGSAGGAPHGAQKVRRWLENVEGGRVGWGGRAMCRGRARVWPANCWHGAVLPRKKGGPAQLISHTTLPPAAAGPSTAWQWRAAVPSSLQPPPMKPSRWVGWGQPVGLQCGGRLHRTDGAGELSVSAWAACDSRHA